MDLNLIILLKLFFIDHKVLPFARSATPDASFERPRIQHLHYNSSDVLHRTVRHRSVPPAPNYFIPSNEITPYHRRDPVNAWKYDSLLNDRLWEYQYSPRSHRRSASREIEHYTPDRFRDVIATSNDRHKILPYLTTKLRQTRIEATRPAQLTCRAIGGPTTRIKWYKNGSEIKQDGKFFK